MKKRKLATKFINLTVLPMLALGIIMLIINIAMYRKNLEEQVKEQLKATGMTVLNAYESMYPGNFYVIGKESYVLMKGDHVVNGEFQFLDSVREDTQTDISIFYSDTRFLTTLKENGQRMVGSTAHAVVVSDVLEDGSEAFYNNTTIGSSRYYVYYRPIYNSAGEIIGMIETAKAASDISGYFGSAIIPIAVIWALLIVIASATAVSFAGRVTAPLGKIVQFARQVKEGDFSAQLDASVLKRNDEIGRMGNSILEMQGALKVLVEEDALTHLNNRHFGEKRLEAIRKDAPNKGACFALAIGDIDFFKRINDHYGHDCGDLVLQNIAAVLKNNMVNKGFVIRWGGEEFLLAFENSNAQLATKHLEMLLDEVRASFVSYGEEKVQVTMTFGVVEGNGTSDLDEMFKAADELLYSGKQQGRNRIMTGGFVGEKL